MAFPVDPVADIRAIRLPLGVALLEQRAQLRDDRSFPGFIVLRLAFPQANDGAEKINLAPIESENLAFAHARVKADRDGQLQIVRQFGHELVVLVAFEKSFSCAGLFRHGEVWDVPKLAIFRSEVKHTTQRGNGTIDAAVRESLGLLVRDELANQVGVYLRSAIARKETIQTDNFIHVRITVPIMAQGLPLIDGIVLVEGLAQLFIRDFARVA